MFKNMADNNTPLESRYSPKSFGGGYVYIDKTDLVWRLQNTAKYIFFSRPRRFARSLLSSTLHSFFEGDKELFEGLKVMGLEKEGASYPVIHFDLNRTKGATSVQQLQDWLIRILLPYVDIYGRKDLS